MSEKTKIYVLSSTHWDREWYQPYEAFRFRLVRMIDETIRILESDPAYRCFHFDGQTVPIEDYLEIRPEMAERLARLIRERRILIGPWYVMPDEFLIGGEALVRNLQRGREICARYGAESCKDGYICDIFGHNSQLPQIFSQFGLRSAALFRGRKGYERAEFLWRGADGTEILTHKLHPDYAYSSFFFVARWPFEDREMDFEEMAARVEDYLRRERETFVAGRHLMIDGVDHIDPECRIPQMLAYLNERLPDYEFVHSDFDDLDADFAALRPALDVAEGCLYEVGAEGVNNALLQNVLSSQVHLKQANAALEARLCAVAEPLDAFVSRTASCRTDRRGFWRRAWTCLLQNQPHDSICGCSVTAAHLDCENRFKRAGEIVEAAERDLFRDFAAHVKRAGKGRDGAFVVFNPAQVAVDGTVEVLFSIKRELHQGMFRFYDERGAEIPFTIVAKGRRIKKEASFKKLIRFAEIDEFTLAMALRVPPLGYTVLTYDLIRQIRTAENHNWRYDRFEAPNRYPGTMRTGAAEADNGPLMVRVESNGTLTVVDKDSGYTYRDLMTIEDTGDLGEGWNYVKPLCDSEYLSTAAAAEVAVEADGPDYLRFRIAQRLRLPAAADPLRVGRGAERKSWEITHFVTVRRGSKRLDVVSQTDNNVVDHRVRVILPTGLATDRFATALPFDLYEWPIARADNARDKEVDTGVNPNQGAVTLGDGRRRFSVYNKGLYEVAVPERADTPVILTLFRSFSAETGEFGADMGRMLRPVRCEYALDFGAHTPSETVKAANAYRLGLVSMACDEEAGEELYGSGGTIAKIEGGAVVSAMVDQDGALTIRIYDVDGGSEGRVRPFGKPVRVEQVDLDGANPRPVALRGGAFAYRLDAKKIATYRVTY